MFNFTVAVPTRDRVGRLKRFVSSFESTTGKDRPPLLFVHDNPVEGESIEYCFNVENSSNIINREKSSLAKLWNCCVVNTDTDWTLICNDDAVFKKGWLEYLQSAIGSDKFLQINLLNYGGFCIHKKMILRNGWFDEHFKGGGFEDNDWQLRLYESKLKGFVDRSHDYTYMEHLKFSDGTDWPGENNSLWILKKWGRSNLWIWKMPSYRKEKEVDWHPAVTKYFAIDYGESSRIDDINTYVRSGRQIFH